MRPTTLLSALLAIQLFAGCGEGDSDQPNDDSTIDDGKADIIAPDKGGDDTTDDFLREQIYSAGVTQLDTGEVLPLDDPKVQLGQALFFDRELSGNRDIACSTCHHPGFGTSDGLSLPIGVGGGDRVGPGRVLDESRGFIPRNSPEIFNRGATAWTTMFWDNRVSEDGARFYSPAGADLPDGLDSVLAVQAMFPVTSGHEMRGDIGENEIAENDSNLPGIWAGLTERLLAIDGYQKMFAAAYPETPLEEIGFQHAANAIAAYEVSAFTKADTPFDRYLAGDDDALTGEQKRGAALFFGDASCSSCHTGALLTDQKTHVVGTPQFGPGKGEDAPLDIGRMLETGRDEDKYAFRTPPLRNVELTGPYMHAGSHTTLREVVEHHLDPGAEMEEYDVSKIDPQVAETMVTDPDFQEDCLSRVSPLLTPKRPITDAEVDELVAFLEALTDPSARDMSEVVPDSVPSGLPIDGL